MLEHLKIDESAQGEPSNLVASAVIEAWGNPNQQKRAVKMLVASDDSECSNMTSNQCWDYKRMSPGQRQDYDHMNRNDRWDYDHMSRDERWSHDHMNRDYQWRYRNMTPNERWDFEHGKR
jgi:hypothetical protein